MNDSLVMLKAKAFDNLMIVLDGKEKCIDNYRRSKASNGYPNYAELTVITEDVPVYQWVILIDGRKDLKQLLLDGAAESIEKEGTPK